MIKRDTQRDTPTFMEKEPQKDSCVFRDRNHSALLGASLPLHVTGYYFNFSADMRGLTPKLRPLWKVIRFWSSHRQMWRKWTRSFPYFLSSLPYRDTKMAKRFRQFRLLLWKNFILQVSKGDRLKQLLARSATHLFGNLFFFQIRRPVGTAFEIALPVLLTCILIIPKWVLL